MTMQVDVAILGGGPAGSVVAGLLAAHGVSVVLIEKTDYGAPRVGESLPPAALPVLRRLELDRAVTDECYFRCPGIITVWGSAAPIEHDFIRMPYGYGLRLDRRRFDQSLANWAASAGAIVFTRTSPHTLRFQQRIWLLQLKGAFHQEVQARFIVDATGRNCFPICGAVKHQYLDRLVALVSVSRKTSLLDQRILIEAGPAGWWYSALLPTGQMMVSFFTDWDLLHYGRDDLWQYLADAPFTAERLRSSELDTPSVYHAPSKLRTNMQGDT